MQPQDARVAAMATEYQITGPPGTGKTHFLMLQFAADAERYGADRVLACSLTRAAAREISARLPVTFEGASKPWVGTLHSICLRGGGLQGLPIGDSPKGIALWNDHIFHLDPPQWGWELSAGIDPDDPHSTRKTTKAGDRWKERMDLARHRLLPHEQWQEIKGLEAFATAWRAWLTSIGGTDFTGMLEAGFDLDCAPGEPAVLLGDEVQDWTPLEIAVIRRWANHPSVDRLYLVGDVDQSLYAFRGANARIFLEHPLPTEQCKILSRSYRVPRAVHRTAQEIIARVDARAMVHYEPRDEDGCVHRVSVRGFEDGHFIAHRIQNALAEKTGSVMFLAPCHYQLFPTLSALRSLGVPYANPYRPRNGLWNPLSRKKGTKLGAVQQVLSYFTTGPWTLSELQAWLALLPCDGITLKHGAKALAKKLCEPWQIYDLESLFADPSILRGAWERDPDWLMVHALESQRKRIEFPLAVFRAAGIHGLLDPPRLNLGTIHSVKGGEADHVFVLTSLALAQREGDPDHVHRLFYVAATRARQSLTWLEDSQGYLP